MIKIQSCGRLCLLGEHSDWAGGYRRLNPNLEKGYAISTGTNQGLYAEVKSHPTHLIFHPTLEDGSPLEPLSLSIEPQALLTVSQTGGFYSYVAGVAYQFLKNYEIGGLEIKNYKTDLPIQKGLASSAAVCVLVARAFNQIYDLKLNRQGEMEMAYLGETTTPSRCGRLDQACAYGSQPILMTFDGEQTEITELTLTQDLFFVIVDLAGKKNTQRILHQLNQCYPQAQNDLQKNVQAYLGSLNAQLVQEAADALQQGDAEQLGRLMTAAQKNFDQSLIPACSSELTAPILHQVLNYEPIQPYIFGGKGVGSQGDGTAQLIATDAASQQKVIEIIHHNFPQMQCFPLTLSAPKNHLNFEDIQSPINLPLSFLSAIPVQESLEALEQSPLKKVRKAIIPAAGFGTRMFPATKGMKKEFFPIIDQNGHVKPIILAIVEEAFQAGIEEIGIVIQPKDRYFFESFFKHPPKHKIWQKLAPEKKKYSQYVQAMGERITFLIQNQQEGYGHAVHCAAKWVKDQPFLLLLGDHLYTSELEVNCARQLLNIYEKVQQSVIGLRVTPGHLIHNYGCVRGTFKEEIEGVLSLTEIYEKPTWEYARTDFQIAGLGFDQFLSIFGLYVLEPKIFDILGDLIRRSVREKGEFQLTSALELLRQQEKMMGYLIQGQCLDTGLPEAYRETFMKWG